MEEIVLVFSLSFFLRFRKYPSRQEYPQKKVTEQKVSKETETPCTLVITSGGLPVVTILHAAF